MAGATSDKPLMEKKKLAPLNEGGPTQLLNLQIQKLEEENQGLRQRMRTVEGQTTEILEAKQQLKQEVESLKSELEAKEKGEEEEKGLGKEYEEVRHREGSELLMVCTAVSNSQGWQD